MYKFMCQLLIKTENYSVLCDVITYVYMSKTQIRTNMSPATFIFLLFGKSIQNPFL